MKNLGSNRIAEIMSHGRHVTRSQLSQYLNMWFGLLHCLRRSRLTITASTFSGIFGKTVVCFGPMYIVERMQAIYMDERIQIMLILDLLTILGGVSLLWLPHHRRLLAGPPPQVPQVETTWPVSNICGLLFNDKSQFTLIWPGYIYT